MGQVAEPGPDWLSRSTLTGVAAIGPPNTCATKLCGPARSFLSTSISARNEPFPSDKVKYLFIFDYGDEWGFKIERTGSGTKVPLRSTRKPTKAKAKTKKGKRKPK